MPTPSKERSKISSFFKNHTALLIVLSIDLFLLIYALLFFLLRGTPFFFLVGSERCTLHELHLYCIGCGGTRAVSALLHGNLLKSLRYNPLPLLWGATLLYTNLATLFSHLRAKKRGLPPPKYPPVNWVLWSALILCALWYVLLLVLLFCGVDLIGDHGSYWRDFFASR